MFKTIDGSTNLNRAFSTHCNNNCVINISHCKHKACNICENLMTLWCPIIIMLSSFHKISKLCLEWQHKLSERCNGLMNINSSFSRIARALKKNNRFGDESHILNKNVNIYMLNSKIMSKQNQQASYFPKNFS